MPLKKKPHTVYNDNGRIQNKYSDYGIIDREKKKESIK